jgi:hypothetical protein
MNILWLRKGDYSFFVTLLITFIDDYPRGSIGFFIGDLKYRNTGIHCIIKEYVNSLYL